MKIVLLVAAALPLLCGCMPTLHPLYSPETLTSLPGLEGNWESIGNGNGPETWRFSQVDSTSYTLEYTENEAPGEFDARVVKLGDYLFLDIAPLGPETENEVYRGLLLPVHMFGRLTLTADTLQIGWLDGDWLGEQIDSGTVALNYETIEEDRLLTAATGDLQAFALKYADDVSAFPLSTLHRATQ